MRLALAHAMEIEPRFDHEPPALELSRRLPVQDFRARGWCRSWRNL
jgi:hypothetical protein